MLTGDLVQWNDERGFGFIAGDDGQRYFVHISSIGRTGDRPRIGDSVTFSPGHSRDGRPRAVAVSIKGANPPADRREFRSRPPRSAPRGEWRVLVIVVLAGSIGAAVLLDRLPWEIALAYLAMGTVSLALYRGDKNAAEAGRWRTSESMLLGTDLCLGILGGLTAQALFRHKTRKTSYIAATLMIVLLHLIGIGGVASGLVDVPDLRALGAPLLAAIS